MPAFSFSFICVYFIVSSSGKNLHVQKSTEPFFRNWTAEEFSSWVKLYAPVMNSSFPSYEKVNANCDEIDWVKKGVVPPVRNQGQMGDASAFAIVGAIQSRYAIENGTKVELSVQELSDCAPSRTLDSYWNYIIDHHGLCSAADYPSHQHSGCMKCNGPRYPISSARTVKQKSSEALAAALCEGPVAVAIEADQNSFQLYQSGILESKCGTNLDHLMLLVGMGKEGDSEYWKLQNSWGADWGEGGFMRMCKNCGMNDGAGECGILLDATFPVI